MTPQEFKAWFDGFTEAFTGLPNKTQWARIKARVAEIDGSSVTERVYIDRYLPTYVPTYVPPYPIWLGPTYTTCGASTASGGSCVTGQNTFNSISAMGELGRLEAHTLAV